mmetsp:Transcript_28612/g.58478  ORF Transcript_28612/g.58478 Transcript_28612/m.58478 type:complete len:252 (+) Transcript_28612:902-1657(+)
MSRSFSRKSSKEKVVVFLLFWRSTFTARYVPSGCQYIPTSATLKRFFWRSSVREGMSISTTRAGDWAASWAGTKAAKMFCAGDQWNSRTAGILMLFLSTSFMSSEEYTWIASGAIFAKYLPSWDHLKGSMGLSLGPSCLNARFFSPVRTSQMMTASGSSLSLGRSHQVVVTRKRSQGEKSRFFTLLCMNLPAASNWSPPHNRRPGLWKVARYVPCGDHWWPVSVHFFRSNTLRSSSLLSGPSFQKISDSSA